MLSPHLNTGLMRCLEAGPVRCFFWGSAEAAKRFSCGNWVTEHAKGDLRLHPPRFHPRAMVFIGLVDAGVIEVVRRGYVRFAVPYLRDYLLDEA